MRNLLFMTFNYDNDLKRTGIGKKITNQYDSFQNNSFFDQTYISGGNLEDYYIYDTDYRIDIQNKFLRRKKRLHLNYKFIKENKINYLYIRYSHFCDYHFLYFLSKIKKNSNCKIYLEIPTYPYDQEYVRGININSLLIYTEKICRNKMFKYVDKVVTFSDDKEIFNIPCINISNGVNLSDVKIIKKKTSDVIRFTSVSSIEFWHGIDRFLVSLETFIKNYPTVNVLFNIVGKGSETGKLKQIVEESDYLKDVVIFHGFKCKEELDNIYNQTDIAIGSLARHRSGISTLKTLKNREYVAKGLPLVYSECDPDFDEQKFVFKVAADESIINVLNIIEWYRDLNIGPEEIRQYAEQFTWHIQMKKVIDSFV